MRRLIGSVTVCAMLLAAGFGWSAQSQSQTTVTIENQRTPADSTTIRSEPAADKIDRTTDKAADKLERTGDKAADKTEKVADKVEDKAQSAADKVEDAADATADKAAKAADKAEDKMDRDASASTAKTSKKAANKVEARVIEANEVFHEMMNAPDKGIPEELLEKAHCIAIVPDVKKVAIFSLGGQHGAGIATCRKNNGTGPWGPPSSFVMSGGSVGLQLGFTDTDYILLFMTNEGMEKLLESKFTIGGDMAAAAGPVGRTAAAATDAQLNAQILTYSRSKGLFAGVALNGVVMAPNHDDNKELYGRDVKSKDLLLGGNITPPPVAQELLATLNRFSAAEDKEQASSR